MKIVGWIFIGFGLFGCLLFLSVVGRWGITGDEIMEAKPNGGASNAPIMIGLLAMAGVYLVCACERSKAA